MNCVHCDTPLPEGSRRDRLYCNHNCRALASYYRRENGASPPPRWQHPALLSTDPVLHGAALRVQRLGEAHGWSESTTRCVLDGLATVLEDRPAGERVPMSEVRARTHRHVSKPRLAEVLADLGLLDDDTPSAVRSWIDRNTEHLPSGFDEPVRRWLVVLLDGDARSRPRTAAAVYSYLGSVRPFLEHWAMKYDHLREVVKADIYAALDPLRGHRRNNALKALRSLFRFAKRHGLVFVNPTTGLKASPAEPSLIPMTDAEIRAVEQLAVGPAERLIIALAAEHAARTGTIRHLTLEHIDLPNRRITLAGHNQRLGELTHGALRLWLDHRRTTWPTTTNRHVIVSIKTALGTAPVGKPYIHSNLGRNGFSVDRIRADRILHEALTAGPDPLHLSLVFHLSHHTASRYTAIAEQLLGDELEQPPDRSHHLPSADEG
jgi:integrase